MSPQNALNAPQSGWSIEYQQETVELGPDGRAVAGVKIGYVTGLGVHASVFVPKAKYTPENVKAAIADAAYRVDQVHKLTG